MSNLTRVSRLYPSVLFFQFCKFSAVGLSNTLLSLFVYYSLLFFGLHYLVANAFAFFAGILNAWFWNSRYVFQSAKDGRAAAFCRMVLSYGLSFILSAALLFFAVDFLSISKYVAPLLTLCVTIPLNFFLNKIWVFEEMQCVVEPDRQDKEASYGR